MSRETENALLLLVGVSTGLITISGAYTRYVKPSLLPWLAVSAVLLIALALVSIARDVRNDGAHTAHDGHPHRSGTAWLLMIPVALLAFVVPPAIGANATGTSVREISTQVLRRPFPPLPAERAPELALPELLMRVAQDSAGTLDNRVITVTGFTMRDGGTTELGRIVILCCAADAQLARIRLDGPNAATMAEMPEGTWVRIEGTVPPGQGDPSRRTVPVMKVTRVERIEAPANPYVF
ncbi:TIGR03943 family protein [Mycolicibacterium sp. S2-37]|uniref:TIGR03943 family putative permease subunit n=1 Tax=Mycolicibacterium sp. S2-37 TaxID=2810297 RepID=UPI001A94B65F|nr:TIGR03943 family protein [Mycolicibacterium sp. S2-37]MBO0680809.1 TIGR03943 family protein [Mycolicibacterium sp. S2-37]